MSEGQIIFYGVLAILLFLYVRRMLRLRSVTQRSASEVAEMVKRKENLLLLDIRTAAERSQSSIKGSLHIPLHELRGRLTELSKHKEKELVCYCATGSRSLSAALLLGKQGYRASSMRGGIAAWNYSQNR